MHGALNIDKNNGESFESSYSVIGQCLSNKNESATVDKNQNFCELNKALLLEIFS